MIAREIVGGEEQENAAAGLNADMSSLGRGGGAGEKDRGGVFERAGRADRDPALVLFGLVCVLDQGEAELADIESERLLIVSDDEGYMSDVNVTSEALAMMQLTRL